MKKESIAEALNGIDFDMVEDAYEAAGAKTKSKRSLWLRWGAAAACLCLCVGAVTLNTLGRLGYFEDTCASVIGEVAAGDYYYEVPHSGIYSYSEAGGTAKRLSTYWFDSWSVNDYGIYYTRGTALYVLPHGSEDSIKLYSSSRGRRIDLALQPDGSVKLSVVGRVKGKYQTLEQLQLDGVTGEQLSGGSAETVYQIGGRQLVRVRREGGCDLLENGVSILPDGVTVGSSPEVFDDGIMFFIDASDDVWSYFVVLADGSEHIIDIAGDPPFAIYGSYVLYLKDMRLWCLDTGSREAWALSADTADYRIYEFVLSGTTVYSCVPWSEAQACWRLNVDAGGRPSSISLVNENISK